MLYYTNGSHKFLLKFCVDEVSEGRGAINMRRIKRGKSSSLGMPKAPQLSKYFKDTQASKLGDASVGIPSFFFNNYRYTSVFVLFTWYASFVFLFFSFMLHVNLQKKVWYSPWLIYRILHVLHLYLLSMILWNCSLSFT